MQRLKHGAGFVVCFIFLFIAAAAWAQVGPRPLQKPESKATDAVRIRKFVGAGRQVLEKTPEYRSSGGSAMKPRGDWAQISVTFDTEPEWIDELVFQYYVMTLKVVQGKRTYSLFKASVKYGDVERGRNHLSCVYLRPNTLKRYGDVVAAAVEILQNGKIVAAESQTEGVSLPDQWWTNPDVVGKEFVTVRDGYLLERSQTPFAFINVDDYEVPR